jgi:hypothetical protein
LAAFREVIREAFGAVAKQACVDVERAAVFLHLADGRLSQAEDVSEFLLAESLEVPVGEETVLSSHRRW